MQVPNVRLHFRSSTGSESVAAPGQHLYLDLDPKLPGVLQHLRSDSTGTIVADPSAPGSVAPSAGPKTTNPAVALDDSRTYQAVVSAAALATVPSVGAPVKVTAGKLVLLPHVAIQVTNDGGKPVGGLECELGIGSNIASVKTTPGGWVLSADRTAGVLTFAVKARLVQAGSGRGANPLLSVAPLKPVRGDWARILITPPSGAVRFKVLGWRYDLSHQNPGSASPATGIVTRPGTENPATFADFWEGLLCASGTVKARFTMGVTLRGGGDAPVAATVVVLDSAETSLAINVEPRTGSVWESALVEKGEVPLTRPVASFHDTGEHKWDPGLLRVETTLIGDGPNRDCTFVKTASITFTSSPFINQALIDAASPFSLAQNQAYLKSPAPVRTIPRQLYSVGPAGAITIKDDKAFAAWILGRPLKANDNVNWVTSGQCIDQPTLLAGTRRHEYQDREKSHKQNCLKARRALDPVKFAEGLVQVPGGSVRFTHVVQERVTAIVKVAATHDVLDEEATRQAGALRFKSGQNILAVNADAGGNIVGPVWNPPRQTELTN